MSTNDSPALSARSQGSAFVIQIENRISSINDQKSRILYLKQDHTKRRKHLEQELSEIITKIKQEITSRQQSLLEHIDELSETYESKLQMMSDRYDDQISDLRKRLETRSVSEGDRQQYRALDTDMTNPDEIRQPFESYTEFQQRILPQMLTHMAGALNIQGMHMSHVIPPLKISKSAPSPIYEPPPPLSPTEGDMICPPSPGHDAAMKQMEKQMSQPNILDAKKKIGPPTIQNPDYLNVLSDDSPDCMSPLSPLSVYDPAMSPNPMHLDGTAHGRTASERFRASYGNTLGTTHSRDVSHNRFPSFGLPELDSITRQVTDIADDEDTIENMPALVVTESSDVDDDEDAPDKFTAPAIPFMGRQVTDVADPAPARPVKAAVTDVMSALENAALPDLKSITRQITDGELQKNDEDTSTIQINTPAGVVLPPLSGMSRQITDVANTDDNPMAAPPTDTDDLSNMPKLGGFTRQVTDIEDDDASYPHTRDTVTVTPDFGAMPDLKGISRQITDIDDSQTYGTPLLKPKGIVEAGVDGLDAMPALNMMSRQITDVAIDAEPGNVDNTDTDTGKAGDTTSDIAMPTGLWRQITDTETKESPEQCAECFAPMSIHDDIECDVAINRFCPCDTNGPPNVIAYNHTATKPPNGFHAIIPCNRCKKHLCFDCGQHLTFTSDGREALETLRSKHAREDCSEIRTTSSMWDHTTMQW